MRSLLKALGLAVASALLGGVVALALVAPLMRVEAPRHLTIGVKAGALEVQMVVEGAPPAKIAGRARVT